MAAGRTTSTHERVSLGAMDLDGLLRLWRNRGGSSREFVDGDVEALHPNGELAMRGTPDAVAAWLRVRLVTLSPMVAS